MSNSGRAAFAPHTTRFASTYNDPLPRAELKIAFFFFGGASAAWTSLPDVPVVLGRAASPSSLVKMRKGTRTRLFFELHVEPVLA